MSDSDAAAAEAAMAAFLTALDQDDRAAIDVLLLPDAGFSTEDQGALQELDREAWLLLRRQRDPAGAGLRNALLMSLVPDAAAFKVDTRLDSVTLTDRVLLRAGSGGWRVASIFSY